MIHAFFSEKEQAELKAAIARAEEQTSGEIVPVIVKNSGRYDLATWKGACMAALGAIGISVLFFHYYHGWGYAWLYTGWGMAFTAISAGILGGLAGTFILPLKRLLAGKETMTRTVHLNAMKAFVQEEVFLTRDRTGILIYVSLFEHTIEVIGDTGINKLVDSDDWVDVVQDIREGIKNGKLADGMIRALERCGVLLKKAGVTVRTDDTNELPNEIRVRRS